MLLLFRRKVSFDKGYETESADIVESYAVAIGQADYEMIMLLMRGILRQHLKMPGHPQMN